jgi:hypothetical protein
MHCIENLARMTLPNDVFMATIKLYYQMGKNEHYLKLFSSNIEFIMAQNAYEEARLFFRIFFPSYKVGESRLRSLRLNSTVARNKGETLVKNTFSVFQLIHNPKGSHFHLNVTEIHDLARMMFKDVYPPEKIQYQKIERQRHSLITHEIGSKREYLEQLIIKLQESKKLGIYESVFLYLNFMVDMMNMEVFRFPENDVIAFLVFYVMMIEEGLIASRYISFFAKLSFNAHEFKTLMEKTKFGWNEGYSEIMPLARFVLRMYHETYLELSEFARDYAYEADLEISKSDYVENTIDKLPDVFQKDDIRRKHPFISDSTINRTLKRLQDDNKIRPLGKGRSAKWVKLYQKGSKKPSAQQLNLDLEDI